MEPPPFEPPLELPDAGTDEVDEVDEVDELDELDDETALLLATLLLVEATDEDATTDEADVETALLLATLLLAEAIDEEETDELDVETLEALDVEDALEESVELILPYTIPRPAELMYTVPNVFISPKIKFPLPGPPY